MRTKSTLTIKNRPDPVTVNNIRPGETFMTGSGSVLTYPTVPLSMNVLAALADQHGMDTKNIMPVWNHRTLTVEALDLARAGKVLVTLVDLDTTVTPVKE